MLKARESRLRVELLGEDKVILDTPLILPYIGLKVREVGMDVIEWLGSFKKYYPNAMVPELMKVIVKVAGRRKLKTIPKEALRGFNFIMYSGGISLIPPTDRDLEIVYELSKHGLNDLFDAILYATSRRTGIKAITLDKQLVNFLEKKGFTTDNLVLLSTIQD